MWDLTNTYSCAELCLQLLAMLVWPQMGAPWQLQLCRDSVDETALLSFAAVPATRAGPDADIISPQGNHAQSGTHSSLIRA